MVVVEGWPLWRGGHCGGLAIVEEWLLLEGWPLWRVGCYWRDGRCGGVAVSGGVTVSGGVADVEGWPLAEVRL